MSLTIISNTLELL